MVSTEMITELELTKPPIELDAIQTLRNRHKDALHGYITELLQNYFMRTQTRKDQLIKDKETWRTNLRSPLTHMFTSGIYNMLLDSDVRFVVVDRKGTYPKVVKNILDMADYFSQNEDFMDAIWSAIFDQCLLGRGCYKTTYVYRKHNIEYTDKDLKKQTIEQKDDYAMTRYVSLYNLFSVGASNIHNQRAICERRLIPSTAFNKEYGIYGVPLKAQEVKDKGVYLDNMDYDAIKLNIPFYNTSSGRDIFEDDTYNIKDKMLEVIEVHTDTTISIRVNSIYHGTFNSLGPLKKIRYHILSFKKNPGIYQGIGVGYIVKPIQDAYDAILNLRMDNVKLVLNKMFFMDASSTMFGNDQVMKVRPGAIFKVRSVDSVKEIQMDDVKQSSYTELDAMFQMTQGLTGVSAPILGIQAKVERTATGAELIKGAADSQMKQPLKSISREMALTLKEIIILSRVYMDPDTMKKICGDDCELLDHPIESLINDFDFNYEMTSGSSDNMTIKRQQLTQLLKDVSTMTDAAGAPVADVRKILEELLRTFNLDFDASLSYEEFAEQVSQFTQARKKIEAETGAPLPGSEEEAAAGGEQKSLVDLATTPGVGAPVAAMPNPTGTQEASPV